eukprot:scpid38818/ scgid10131/ 
MISLEKKLQSSREENKSPSPTRMHSTGHQPLEPPPAYPGLPTLTDTDPDPPRLNQSVGRSTLLAADEGSLAVYEELLDSPPSMAELPEFFRTSNTPTSDSLEPLTPNTGRGQRAEQASVSEHMLEEARGRVHSRSPVRESSGPCESASASVSPLATTTNVTTGHRSDEMRQHCMSSLPPLVPCHAHMPDSPELPPMPLPAEAAEASSAGQLPAYISQAKAGLQHEYESCRLPLGAGMFDTVEDISKNGEILQRLEDSVANMETSYVDVSFALCSSTLEHFNRKCQVGRMAQNVFNLEHIFACDDMKTYKLQDVFSARLPGDRSRIGCDDAQRDPRTFLFKGSGGMGKTCALFKKLPYEWARGRMLTNVHLLICLDLADVDNWLLESLEALLMQYVDLDREEMKNTLLFIEQNPGCLGFVLDSFDACNLECCSPFMRKVLHGEELYPSMFVATVSRSCPALDALARTAQFDRRFEVVGFRGVDVWAHIAFLLPLPPIGGREFLKTISKATCSLISTPFIVSKLCGEHMINFKKGNLSYQSLTQVFSTFCWRLIDISVTGNENICGHPTASCQKMMHLLSQFAFQALIKRRRVFSESDFTSAQLPREVLTSGFFCQLYPNDWRVCVPVQSSALARLLGRSRCIQLYPLVVEGHRRVGAEARPLYKALPDFLALCV